MRTTTTETESKTARNTLTDAWALALLCFVVAGAGGILFRYLMLHPMNIDPVNLRHAHSHLMSFGWLTPALFIMLCSSLPKALRASFRPIILTTLALGLASFPLFAMYGYGRASILGANLPPGVIISTLCMLCWYVFAAQWWTATRNIKRDFSLLVWDLSLVFLLLSTFGAWGIAALQAGHLQSANPKMLTHWFLLLFKEGWVILGVVGLLFRAAGLTRISHARLAALGLICLGLPFSVPLTLGAHSAIMPGIAKLGAWMASAGLLQLVVECALAAIVRRRLILLPPLFFLFLKGCALMIVSLLPVLHLVVHMGTAIFYLHILLLGGATLGLLSVAPSVGIRIQFMHGMTASVCILLTAMLPFTLLLPRHWFGMWSLEMVFYASMPPVVLIASELAFLVRRQRQPVISQVPAYNPLTD